MKELKQVGLKITHPRVTILELLQNSSKNHYKAEDIYNVLREQGDDIGLATIYRVLSQFESAGILIKHNFEGQAIYELDTGEHHDHLICLKCNSITEFYDAEIEKKQFEIAEKYGFTLVEHDMILYGLCKNCQKKW